jgi:putative ABC transport system permease protein
MQTLRNVFKRKLRVILTISGITIGVFALVAMGSMAERINLMVSGGTRYYSDKVTVQDKGASLFDATKPLAYSKLEEIKAVSGVAEVQGEVATLLDPMSGMSMGMPALLGGSDLRGSGYESFKIAYAQGRELQPDDTGVVVVGSELVKKLGAKIGQAILVRGEQFKVVGIMEPTLTIPDSSVYMSLSDARRLYLQDFPEAARAAIAAIDPVVDFVVYPTPGTDPEELAARINEAVPGVKASGPSVFKDQITSMTRIFNYILYGVALIALVVGALSVINTMTMAVSERTREIGMRKAIGGVTGLFLGWAAAMLANKALENSGMSLFLVTPRLAIGSVIFAIFLGIVAGFMPSLHAARMKPVDALRYE